MDTGSYFMDEKLLWNRTFHPPVLYSQYYFNPHSGLPAYLVLVYCIIDELKVLTFYIQKKKIKLLTNAYLVCTFYFWKTIFSTYQYWFHIPSLYATLQWNSSNMMSKILMIPCLGIITSYFYLCACVLCHFSCVQLFATQWMWSLAGSSVHGILQTRILDWVAIPFSRGSSQTREWTHIS